jgi:hypothetical protein
MFNVLASLGFSRGMALDVIPYSDIAKAYMRGEWQNAVNSLQQRCSMELAISSGVP